MFSVFSVVIASSNNIRTEGVYASSYCPLFTDQIKATKNPVAMVRLADNKMIMTLISDFKDILR